MKYIDKMQFTPATINRKEYEFLASYATRYNIKSVLEFGPGVSTYAMKESGCFIMSFEHTESFHSFYAKKFADDGLTGVIVARYVNSADVGICGLDGKAFDMAFIDSPPGIPGASQKPFNRLNTCLFASRHTKRILLHDSFRIGERLAQMVFDQMGWRVLDINTDGYGICEMTL